MKAHNLILFLCFALFLFSQMVFAADFSGSKTVVAYVQPNQGNPYYAYGTFGIDIGYKYVSEAGASEKARTKFTFDLTTIPGNADIISVSLSYYAYNYVNGTYKFKLTQIGNYQSPQEIWQNIGQANSIFTDVIYSSGSLNSGTLTSMVNSSKGSYLYIGALSQNENSSDSRANLDLTLNVQYSVPSPPVTITADNNFTASGGTNHGTMIIDGTNRTIPLTGYTFTKTVGQILTLSANTPQQDNQGYQRIWHTGAVNKSDWRRNGELKSYDQNYSFTVAADDDGKTYMANLRKNYAISRNDQTEFDGTVPAGVVTHIVEQNSGQLSAPSTQTINGKLYNFSYWTDNFTAPNPRTITPSGNATYTALYKYPNHSNTTLAYSSNSQKKLVRTPNGDLHKVYSSMGYVWYEKSTNNGTTWTVENNGKPLSSNEAKLPAIDFMGSEIIIVWQEKYYDTYKIRLAHYQRPGSQLVLYDVYDASVIPPGTPYSYNARPVIAWANNRILVVWQYNYGILYRYGYADCYGPTTWYTDYYGAWVTGADENSVNPTMAIRKDGGATAFHLAWQQSVSAIKYCTLTPDVRENISISSVETPSSGSGFNFNISPSISIKYDGYPTLVWVGSIYQSATTQVAKRSRSSSSWGTVAKYGSSVNSPTEYNSIVVWSEGNTNKLYRPWRGITTLSTFGQYVQLSNGSSMYAVAYRQYSPYDFQTSPNVIMLSKENSEEINLSGESKITSYDLFQNYPNPFNPATTIKYQIPEDGLVTLKVYDIVGNEVAKLLNEYKETGKYEVSFDASKLSSGIYIYKIQVNDFISSKKMILLK